MMKHLSRSTLAYAAATVLVLLFGIIYTYFGYGVTSPYMSYAFLPLLAITLFSLVTCFVKTVRAPRGHAALFLAYFAAALTLYLITKGVFGIAGAYSEYDKWLLVIALILGGMFSVTYTVQYFKNT